MVRVIYLLAISDDQRRNELIAASLNGQMWKRESDKGRVSDREMVELADQLHGWTRSVYRFGCGFIHLSNFHFHLEGDILAQLDEDERKAVIKHLRFYHGGPNVDRPTIQDIGIFLPDVFRKITTNLEYYLDTLESGEMLDLE